MVENNRVKKVAIVGATGTVGKFITKELLARGQHEVTAVTRGTTTTATSDIPAGVKQAPVDYSAPETLVAALRGQDALIITMSTLAPPGTELQLIEAAAAAKVPFVLPNYWCPDTADPKFADEWLGGKAKREVLARLAEKAPDGTTAWIGMITSFWYEYSLGLGANQYGMDWKKRTFTFFDDGETKINTITWPQSGRAVAALLSLPVEPETAGGPSLSAYRNKPVYVSSFCVSQKDMLESVLRVSGTSRSDWTIRHEDSRERWEAARERLFSGGDRSAFGVVMYTRVFFKDGDMGNYEKRLGLANELLGLPREDIDEFTKIAIERAEAGVTYH